MSERFSVEDILNEVKGMTGSNYISKNPNSVKEASEASLDDEPQTKAFVAIGSDGEKEAVTPVKKQTETKRFSDMSADDFFKMLDDKAEIKEEQEEKEEIQDGFKIVEQEQTEPEPQAIEETEPQAIEETAPEQKQEPSVLDATRVFDTAEIKKAYESAQETVVKPEPQEPEQPQEIEQVEETEQPQAIEETAVVKETEQDVLNLFKRHNFGEHKPSHLLSADEIINGELDSAKSARFSSRMSDLSNQQLASRRADELGFTDDSESEKESLPQIEQIQEAEPETEQIVAPETEPTQNEFSQSMDELIAKAFGEKAQPTIEEIPEEEVENPFKNAIQYEKATPTETEDVASFSAFAKKTSRRIEEVEMDYTPAPEVDDDYCSIEDEEPVREDIDTSIKKITKTQTILSILFVLSCVFTLIPEVFGVGLFTPFSAPQVFALINAVILLFAVGVNFINILRGFRFGADANSAIVGATVFVVLQTACSFIPSLSPAFENVPTFTTALIFGYILSLKGKKSAVLRIKKNFRLVANTTLKNSCFVADERLGELLEEQDFIGAPRVVASKKVINFHNFLANSYCVDPADNFAKVFSPLSIVISAVVLLAIYFSTKDFATALSSASAVSVVASPVCCSLVINNILRKSSDLLRQNDGLITGFSAVNDFSNIDCIAIPAEDILPAGSIQITSLRSVGTIAIEDVILKSASLTIGAGGPLADVFDKVIDGRRKMLEDVSDITYEDNLGLTGTIGGRVVRLGNREFIDSYGILGLFDEDIETQAKKNGCFVLYLAIEDEVCGMFSLKYKSVDPDTEDALYELVKNGITIAIKSNDPTITPELIGEIFDIDKDYVIVMPSHTVQCYDEQTVPCEHGDSALGFTGHASLFPRLVVACKKIQSKLSVAIVIQAILTILGFSLCAFSCITGNGISYVTALGAIAFQFAMMLISRIISSFVKRIK